MRLRQTVSGYLTLAFLLLLSSQAIHAQTTPYGRPGPPTSMNGTNQQAGGQNNYSGFNPQTGTWSNTPVTNPFVNYLNGFNSQNGTWNTHLSGMSPNAQGGSWSSQQGASGAQVNVFTPSQVPSGSSSSGMAGGGNANLNSSGPKVIPHVADRPRPPILNRVPDRPRL